MTKIWQRTDQLHLPQFIHIILSSTPPHTTDYKKPFDKFTISDLQRASPVVKTTFYSSFDNISDVLYRKCDICFKEVLGKYEPQQFPNEIELSLHYFRYWMNHSDILELLIGINRQDIIYACHIKNAKLFQKRHETIHGLSKSQSNYFMCIRTGFTISILTAWLDGGWKETPEEIVEILREQLMILANGIRYAIFVIRACTIKGLSESG